MVGKIAPRFLIFDDMQDQNVKPMHQGEFPVPVVLVRFVERFIERTVSVVRPVLEFREHMGDSPAKGWQTFFVIANFELLRSLIDRDPQCLRHGLLLLLVHFIVWLWGYRRTNRMASGTASSGWSSNGSNGCRWLCRCATSNSYTV